VHRCGAQSYSVKCADQLHMALNTLNPASDMDHLAGRNSLILAFRLTLHIDAKAP